MPTLRSLILLVVLVSLLPTHGSAAETGTIRGQVINESSGGPEAGVKVVLSVGSPGSNESETIEQVTDGRGRYVFDRLPTGNENLYAIDAFFEGGMFSGGALTLPDTTDEPPLVKSKLRVWDTTTDPSALLIGRNDVFLSTNDSGGAGAIESVSIANTSDNAYIGRGGDDEGAEPGRVATVGFALPPEADNAAVSIVDADIDVPALIATEYGFAITAALPPGETRFTFSYPVEGLSGSFDMSRRALYPIADFSLYAAPPLEVESNRLVQDGEQEVGGTTYEVFSIEDRLDAGDSIQAVAIADAGTPAGLLAGMAGVLFLALLLGAIPFIRSRRDKKPEPRTRDELVRAIAALDIEHEEGDLPTDQWAARRAELKSKLAALEHRETAGR